MKETNMKVVHEQGIGIFGVETTYDANDLPKDEKEEEK